MEKQTGTQSVRGVNAHIEGWRFSEDVTPEMKLAGARSIRDTMNIDNFTERAAACYSAMRAARHEGVRDDLA